MAAVATEPANDVYQFNLAVLQIHSPDPEKNAVARNQLERLSKVPHFRTEALRAKYNLQPEQWSSSYRVNLNPESGWTSRSARLPTMRSGVPAACSGSSAAENWTIN